MSLSEIAENLGISRSAVGNTVKTVEKKLQNYENLLQVLTKNEILKECLKEVKEKELQERITKILS